MQLSASQTLRVRYNSVPIHSYLIQTIFKIRDSGIHATAAPPTPNAFGVSEGKRKKRRKKTNTASPTRSNSDYRHSQGDVMTRNTWRRSDCRKLFLDALLDNIALTRHFYSSVHNNSMQMD